MERLTQKDAQGNWSLKGVRWEDITTGKTITEEVSEKLYGALWKLMEYEESEPDPEKVAELKERDKPRKIELNAGVPICPVCGRRVVRCYDFCPDCGQRLEHKEGRRWRENWKRH